MSNSKILLPLLLFSFFSIISNMNITSCGNFQCLYGKCMNSTQSQTEYYCQCDDQYKSIENSNLKCSYKLKSYLLAFLLEALTMSGAGHMYLGKTVLGIVKLSLLIIQIIIIVVLRIYTNDKEEYNLIALRISIFGFIFLVVILFWHFVDILLFSIRKYKDSNGIDLI